MSKRSVIDGFVPRRSPTSVGSDLNRTLPPADLANFQRTIAAQSNMPKHAHKVVDPAKHEIPQPSTLRPAQNHGLSRSDIDDSLREIDQQPTDKKHRRGRKAGGKHPRRRKIIKWLIILIVLGLIAAGAYVGIKAVLASNSVFKGDVFGLVQQKKLQQDDGGRTNILIFGTSEDDPGHEAAWLTDSILVLSINQETKDAYMFSIPRDLEVKYGDGCNYRDGYRGKINVVYGCNYKDGTDEEAGALALKDTVSEVTGLTIPYYAHVNYSVVRDIVSALGTITVNIEGGQGAPGILDSNFDWKCKGGNERASKATMIKNCPPNGHYIEYPNGPAELDAEHALYLAQARGDGALTYGLGRSNPDREQNQQKIIVAIKDKALSSGTLTNIGKVTGLIDAVGKNLRTNFDTSEIRTLMTLGQEVPNESITRLDLIVEQVMRGDGQPVQGNLNFTQLHAYFKKTLYATGIAKEAPNVIVLNATGVGGVAQQEVNVLSDLGMDAVAGNAPEGSYQATMIYRVGKAPKKATAEKLKSLYGAEPKYIASIPGVTLGEDTDYVVILVTQPKSTTTTE